MIRPFVTSFLILISFVLYNSQAVAQQNVTVDIDTITLIKLQPGMPMRDLKVRVDEKIDTVIWGGPQGAGMLKFTKSFMGFPGEFRVATENGYLTQITFNTSLKNQEEVKEATKKIAAAFEKTYGPPDERYNNVYQSTKWRGSYLSLAIQSMDNSNYVSVVLAGKPKPSRPVPPPAVTPSKEAIEEAKETKQEEILKPTRKRPTKEAAKEVTTKKTTSRKATRK